MVMSEFTATLSSKGQLTIPVEVRKQLGLESGDKVSLVVDGDWAKLQKVEHTVDSVWGSIPALPGVETGDFDDLIEEVMEQHAAEFIERMRRGGE
jgi:antitoxin PrlF